METGKTLLIHDLPPRLVTGRWGEVIAADERVHACMGCFSCWIRTPGVCAIPDGYDHMGRSLAACETVWIAARCRYGAPGPAVKAVLDRSIPYLHPDFEVRGGKMCHKMRLEHHPALTMLFYGELTREERRTVERWTRAMADGLGFVLERVAFYETAEQLEGLL